MDSSAAKLLTESQVAETYGLGLRMLRSLRMRNTGPRYVKVSGRLGCTGGRILYPVQALDDWINSRPSGGERIETRPLAMVGKETR